MIRKYHKLLTARNLPRRIRSRARGAEGESVGLRALLDGRLLRGVEEEVGVVGGVLGLNEAIQLGVLGCLLAEH